MGRDAAANGRHYNKVCWRNRLPRWREVQITFKRRHTGLGTEMLKAEINEEAWSTLHSDTSRPFDKPSSGRIAVKVINHLGDEVMKVFRVDVR